jgi:phosphomannomutase
LRADGLAERGLVIGYDTRFSSEHFGAAVAEVMAGNGIRSFLTDRAAPTPVVSFTIIDQKAGGGVMITASHNPAIWNGFKVRGSYGGAAAPEALASLEASIGRVQANSSVRRADFAESVDSGLINLIDFGPRYAEHVTRLIDLESLRSSGIKIVHDAMYGSGAGWVERLAGGGTTRVIEINGERNPSFPGISPEPITKNLAKLLAAVPAANADIGIATDGDADRLGVCDEKGNFVDQLRVISLLALYLLEVRGMRGPIVKTLSTSSMLDKLGKLYDVPVHETGVGFKFVAPKMLETDAVIGGEESGGYAFRGHLPERDGILAGLFVADMCNRLNKRTSELVEYLFDKVGPHYYDRLDLHFPADQRRAIIDRLDKASPDSIEGTRVARVQTEDGYKYTLTDESWLLIRFSGTEPIMRIYTETNSPDRVQPILQAGRALTGV